MVDFTFAIKAAKQLDESVGLIAKVLGKLKANPDAAAVKLSEALDEIGKTYRAVDEGIAAYLGLAFVPQGVNPNSQALLDVQGGRLLGEVERGRGHCHHIDAIYHIFLDKWFSKVLNPTDFDEMKVVFTSLGGADFDMFGGLVEVAQMLQTEADHVLDLILAGKTEDARLRVRDVYVKLKPLRLQLGEGMKQLYTLRNEFVEMTGVVW